MFSCFITGSDNKCKILTPIEFYEMINSDPAPLILDVRLYEDYSQSRIPDAIWAGSREELYSILKDTDKEQNIYLYCYEGGKRGKAVVRILHEKGYQNLFFLKGGFNNWTKQGMVTDNSKFPVK